MASEKFDMLHFDEDTNGSKIYKVLHRQLDEVCSLEVIPKKHIDHVNITDTTTEWTAHEILTNNHVINIKYSRQSKKNFFVILSEINNKANLENFIKGSYISNEISKYLVDEILTAIVSLHKRSLTYGKLTSDNILFNNYGHVVLKRTIHDQTYWGRDECLYCYYKVCANENHLQKFLKINLEKDKEDLKKIIDSILALTPHDQNNHETRNIPFSNKQDIEKLLNSHQNKTANSSLYSQIYTEVPRGIEEFVREKYTNQNLESSFNSDTLPPNPEHQRMSVKKGNKQGMADITYQRVEGFRKTMLIKTKKEIDDEKARVKEMEQQRKNIEKYEKRIVELTAKMEKDRNSPRPKARVPTAGHHSPSLDMYFTKLYAENETIRTIFLQYGLLTEEQITHAKNQTINVNDLIEVESIPQRTELNAPPYSAVVLDDKMELLQVKSTSDEDSVFEKDITLDSDSFVEDLKTVERNAARSNLTLNMQLPAGEDLTKLFLDKNDLKHHEETAADNGELSTLITKLDQLQKRKSFQYLSQKNCIKLRRHASDISHLGLLIKTCNENLHTQSRVAKSLSTYSQSSGDEDIPKSAQFSNHGYMLGKKPLDSTKDSSLPPINEMVELCHDCADMIQVENFTSQPYRDNVCNSCACKRKERKDAIIELIETEINYGNDLKLIKEEFYNPMKKNSVCSQNELTCIFSNLQELVDANTKLCQDFQDGLQTCRRQKDLDCITLPIGTLFLNNVEFFEAYELYCSKQKHAVETLKSLSSRSEILRVFLSVSAKDNLKLRKMELKSFLTMPVQRIMKYPLLLQRIYKKTAITSNDKNFLKLAITKTEEQINKINSVTQQVKITRTSTIRSPENILSLDKLKVKRLICNSKDWKPEQTTILLDNNFTIVKGDIYKSNVNKHTMKKAFEAHTYLCIYEKNEATTDINENMNSLKSDFLNEQIKEAIILIIKKSSNDKYTILQDPINVKSSVMTTLEQRGHTFEITEIERETLIFSCKDYHTVDKWKYLFNLIIQAINPKWRQRRNGLSNIMIQSFE